MALDISLYQPRIFDYFQKGVSGAEGSPVAAKEFFRAAIAQAYNDIADRFDCALLLSPTRVEEARVYWARDLPRIDIEGSQIPDHFKHSGFLIYWLRRRIVVEIVSRIGAVSSPEQSLFLNFGNEICAFMVGFRLSGYFHHRRSLAGSRDASQHLATIGLDDRLRHDVVTLLRHKEVSPHALYLILAALFSDVGKPQGSGNVTRLVKRGT